MRKLPGGASVPATYSHITEWVRLRTLRDHGGTVCSPGNCHHDAWTYSLSFFPRIMKWPEFNGQLSSHAFVTDSFIFYCIFIEHSHL